MNSITGISGQEFRSMVAGGFRRRTPESPLTWLPKHIRYVDGWETTQFDFDVCPHVRGFIERFVLDPTKRKGVKVWAVRTSKTTTDEALMMWKAAEDPVPMAILFADNGQLETVDTHLYPLMEKCEPIAEQLPPEHDRNKRAIPLRDCTIRLASGGKPSSVSGFPAQWVFKFEHDKINTRRSSEADPSKRIDSRTAGFCRNVKIFEEGSPCEKYKSRAYKTMTSPDVQQLKYYVQCPHCKNFQVLHHDNLEWDKNEFGKSEPLLAQKTAWYRCSHGGCRIEDHHRVVMMQGGKWLIDGEKINKDGKVSGVPNVESDTMCFWLSKLYSLLIPSWGTIAAELVTARHAKALGDVEPIKTLYTEGFAIPWDPQSRTVRTNELAVRLRAADHHERYLIPDWASFLTMTVDVGKLAEEYLFYWMVVAWGGNARGGIVDWGNTKGKAAFLKEWMDQNYPTPSGQRIALWGQPACIDAGTYSHEIGEMCKPIKQCYPSRGDSSSNFTELYRPGYQRVGLTTRELDQKRKANKYDLLLINSEQTQQWRVSLIEGGKTVDTPGFVSLPADVCDNWEEHESLLEEITADVFIDGEWKSDENEMGDTLRYARALAECVTSNGKRWGKLPLLSNSSRIGPRFFSRSGGSPSTSQDRPFVEGFR